MQLLKLTEKNSLKSIQKRFESWKFAYLGNREGFHVITQTKHLHMEYSDNDLFNYNNNKGGSTSRKMLDKDYSADSKSFYTDFSAASLPKSPSPATNMVTQQQIVLTKCLAACFRYKSRRVANHFWRWKYMQTISLTGRSTIQRPSQMSPDSEVADLIQKYKLLGHDEAQLPSNNNNNELMTEENIDDGDEAVISNAKKQDFEQPV